MIHYISFSKWSPTASAIRVQFAIKAGTRHEARTIAEKEISNPQGYRYAGCD